MIQVLEDFPSVQMPLEWLVQLVPPLKTRAFSISSSLAAHPNHVHLTVNVVSWTTPFKRKRSGLCSMWLSKLDPEQGISKTLEVCYRSCNYTNFLLNAKSSFILGLNRHLYSGVVQ